MKGGVYKVFLVFTGLILLGVFLWLLSYTAHASDGHLVINEVYPNPTMVGSDNSEWVEIYNTDGSALNLPSYSLIKITSSNREYKYNSGELSSSLCQTDNNVYYVCNIDNGWLSNSGTTLVLRRGSEDIDKITYGPSLINAEIPLAGQSISRIPSGYDSDNDANDFQIVPITKGSENLLPPPIVYSDKVYINELLPQPATGSGDEFIELYNSSNLDIDLINWQLDAGTFEVSTIVAANSYRVFKKSEISFGLTDIGDTVNLIDPNGDLKSTVTYGKTTRGQSYSKFDGAWQWTTTQTPQAANVLTVETVLADVDPVITPVSIQTARNLPDDTTVIVTGTVSTPPGVLGTQYFYIQDDTAGLQIYNYNKAFPALQPGDIVQVTGELTSYQNERRLKTSLLTDIVITGSRPPPAPIELKIDDLSESFEGEYVQVTGTVTKTSGDTFYIHGSGELKVIIRSMTGIDKPRMSVGDRVEIAGIYSQYGADYRILPTVQDDVKIIGRGGGLPESGSGLEIPFLLSALLLIIFRSFLCHSYTLPCHSRSLFCHSREGGNPMIQNCIDSRLRGNDGTLCKKH